MSTKKIDGAAEHKQVLIDTRLKTGNVGQKNKADWEKTIKEAKVRVGL
jgi:hypothetical protein